MNIRTVILGCMVAAFTMPSAAYNFIIKNTSKDRILVMMNNGYVTPERRSAWLAPGEHMDRNTLMTGETWLRIFNEKQELNCEVYFPRGRFMGSQIIVLTWDGKEFNPLSKDASGKEAPIRGNLLKEQLPSCFK